MSKLSCIPKQKCIPKPSNYCVSQEKADDIYGFTPNWPDDWNNTRACHIPMSSLSQDIGEDHERQNPHTFLPGSLLNHTVDENPTSYPIYSINHMMRNIPQHNTVLVAPETRSELYLECTLSARWLLVEKYQQNNFEISSGGSSLVQQEDRQGYPEISMLESQGDMASDNPSKKKPNRILSTLV